MPPWTIAVTPAESSDLSKFLWQLALVGATAMFGVLAEWARRMLPPPRERRSKRHKLALVKPPRTKTSTPRTTDDDTA